MFFYYSQLNQRLPSIFVVLNNKQKTLKRKSVGIALTKERLENFSKSYTKKYNIKIEDLYDTQGYASGTKVILDIPIHLISKENV